MSESSVARIAHHDPLELIADLVEEEIARLRKRRPGLSERLDRAANILVAHLACRHGGRTSRTIRVRLRADGRTRFLVKSLNKQGAVYAVDPTDWSCNCPDYHRRGATTVCKHSAACYILWRISHGMRPCAGCRRRFPRRDLIELHEDNHDDLTYFHGDFLCGGCADGAGVIR